MAKIAVSFLEADRPNADWLAELIQREGYASLLHERSFEGAQSMPWRSADCILVVNSHDAASLNVEQAAVLFGAVPFLFVFFKPFIDLDGPRIDLCGLTEREARRVILMRLRAILPPAPGLIAAADRLLLCGGDEVNLRGQTGAGVSLNPPIADNRIDDPFGQDLNSRPQNEQIATRSNAVSRSSEVEPNQTWAPAMSALELPFARRETKSRRGAFVAAALAGVAILVAWVFREKITEAISHLGFMLHAGRIGTDASGLAAGVAMGIGDNEELVRVSAFAPIGGAAGEDVLVQALLHKEEQAAEARRTAIEADADSQRRATATLELPLAYGSRVDVVLEGRGLAVDESIQSVVWRGQVCCIQFIAALPDTQSDSSIPVRLRVLRDGVPIGSLRFVLKVEARRSASTELAESNLAAPGRPSAESRARQSEARHYRRAFLSYASSDRAEVLKRAQALRALGVEIFQDVLSLEPGEEWAERLYEEIPRCDLFLLFWSRGAAASSWVRREAECALAAQKRSASGSPDLMPIILEGPPIPMPIPDDLKHLHFNDSLLYAIAFEQNMMRAN